MTAARAPLPNLKRIILESPSINGKRCSKCAGIKPLSQFVKDKNRKNGRHPQCSSCVTTYKKKWKQRPEVIERNREYQLDYSRLPQRKVQIHEYQTTVLPSGITRAKKFKIKYKYGLTEEDYFTLLKSQDYRCAACRVVFDGHEKTQIDHCHATGKIRGLLCVHCNRALGQVVDSVEILSALIKYLQRG